MTTVAPKQTPVMSDNYDERSKQVAALVAARKAQLAAEQAAEQEKAKNARLYALMFAGDKGKESECYSATDHSKNKKETSQIRVGGSKGKEGGADHTRGKVRRCVPLAAAVVRRSRPRCCRVHLGGGDSRPSSRLSDRSVRDDGCPLFPDVQPCVTGINEDYR